jgi:uncharacterized protein (DUF2235 family)
MYMKKIIVCCDGTWNKPDTYEKGVLIKTNVQRIYEAIGDESGDKQVKFYDPGVGTGFSLKDRVFGGGFGRGIDRNIQDAYKFLMWNYEQGDQIYLYGFSRGAYTVRSLAGFVRNSGILKPEYLQYVDEAYSLYRDRTSMTHPDSDTMKGFRRTYAIEEETNIYFIGIWDTVGALGIPASSLNWYNTRYHFHDVKLSSKVKYAYHALSVDEQRKIFEPSLWEVSESQDAKENDQKCEQVWFSGVHSNVGGGYADTGLSDIALQWMINKSRETGLTFIPSELDKIKANSCGELVNSATGLFKILPKISRQINKGIVQKKDPATGKLTEVKVKTNESVHYTCFERCHKNEAYRPPNFFSAVDSKIPYSPAEDQWEKDWLDYLTVTSTYKKPAPSPSFFRAIRMFLTTLFSW